MCMNIVWCCWGERVSLRGRMKCCRWTTETQTTLQYMLMNIMIFSTYSAFIANRTTNLLLYLSTMLRSCDFVLQSYNYTTSVCSLTAQMLHKHIVTISYTDDNSKGGCFILAMHFHSNTATQFQTEKSRVPQTPCIAKLFHPPPWGCAWVAAHASITVPFKHVTLVICAIKDNKPSLLITQGI